MTETQLPPRTYPGTLAGYLDGLIDEAQLLAHSANSEEQRRHRTRVRIIRQAILELYEPARQRDSRKAGDHLPEAPMSELVDIVGVPWPN